MVCFHEAFLAQKQIFAKYKNKAMDFLN